MATYWDDRPDAAGPGRPLPPPAAPQARMDPYLRWATETGWRGMTGEAGWDRRPEDDEWVQILARADDAAALDEVLNGSGPFNGLLYVSPVYRVHVPGGHQRALHFTGWVRRQRIHELHELPLRARWELSQPRRDAERRARGSAAGRFGPTRNLIDFTPPNPLADTVAQVDVAVPPPQLDRAIVVIDFGCPFLNTAYSPAPGVAGTRVARLWDQGGGPLDENDTRARTWPWQAIELMGYGREIHADRLQAMAERLQAPRGDETPSIEESAAYRGIDHLIDYDDPRRRVWYATHGSHVLDVAGGTTDPLSGLSDAAGEAPLVFVQLASMTAADSSGASLAGHVLDAVRWALWQCKADAPVVVSISYGSRAGPHDGHSLIETAFDELLRERSNNFAIVLAAGNARQQGCHVRRMLAPQRSALLRCEVAAGDTTDTFVEAWYRPPPAGWQVQARVRGPDRVWTQPRAADGQVLQRDAAAGDGVVAMLRHESRPPGGDGLCVVLLALAPTAAPSDVPCPLAAPGVWEIELMLVRDPNATVAAPGAPQVEVNAWIERDDPGTVAGALPHRFLDLAVDDDLDTLSSLATGELTVVAGGFRRSTGRSAEYSSVGPQRGRSSPVPFVLGACEEDDVNLDVPAAAVRSGDRWRMNGTSVAAPAVARQLFNAMVRGPSVGRDRWREVLLALAAVPGGPVRLPDDDGAAAARATPAGAARAAPRPPSRRTARGSRTRRARPAG